MTNWEYLKVNTQNGLAVGVSGNIHYTVWFDADTHKVDTEMFNELGQDGWELTSTEHSDSNFITYWFKRPLPHNIGGDWLYKTEHQLPPEPKPAANPPSSIELTKS